MRRASGRETKACRLGILSAVAGGMSGRARRWLVAGCIVSAVTLANGRQKPAPASWMLVHSRHFTVLTAGSPHTAQLWANDLERFRAGLEEIMPVDPARLAPVVMVIFPNERAFRPYKMLQNGKPAEIGGFFSSADGVNAIGLAIDVDPLETRRLIFHEATHWYFSARDERPPPWLEEGIAEVFSTFLADADHFMVGDSIVDHVRFLRSGTLLPLEQLLGTARADIDYHEQDRTGRFYAESWLFVHWAMFGDGSPGAGSLARYVKELRTASDPEAAFKDAFGGDYHAIDRKLARYLRGGKYFRRTYVLNKAGLAAAEPPRRATEAETEFGLGALQLGGRGPGAALSHLTVAVRLDPGNTLAWEALGFAQLRLGDRPQALTAFDHAARLGSRDALVWCDRAALRQAAELPAGEFVVTTDTVMFNESATDYRQAIALDPRCQAAYRGLAGVVYGTKPADAADLSRLEQGLRRFPDDTLIAVGAAAARLRVGDRTRAEKELRAIYDGEHIAPTVRQLARSALEGEMLAKLTADFATDQRQRHYARLLTEIDGALAGNLLSRQNRWVLAAQRKQVDQLRRVDEAVDLLNKGQGEKAEAMLKAILDEPPASGIIRLEVERLLKEREDR